jgi:hypothetical protein
MSSSFHQKTKKLDPLGHAAVEGVFGIEKQEKKIASAQAAQDAELAQRKLSDEALQDKMRVAQVGERRQQAGAAASAAGATRVRSDADLLGFSGGAKRRASSRVLLGE